MENASISVIKGRGDRISITLVVGSMTSSIVVSDEKLRKRPHDVAKLFRTMAAMIEQEADK